MPLIAALSSGFPPPRKRPKRPPLPEVSAGFLSGGFAPGLSPGLPDAGAGLPGLAGELLDGDPNVPVLRLPDGAPLGVVPDPTAPVVPVVRAPGEAPGAPNVPVVRPGADAPGELGEVDPPDPLDPNGRTPPDAPEPLDPLLPDDPDEPGELDPPPNNPPGRLPALDPGAPGFGASLGESWPLALSGPLSSGLPPNRPKMPPRAPPSSFLSSFLDWACPGLSAGLLSGGLF